MMDWLWKAIIVSIFVGGIPWAVKGYIDYRHGQALRKIDDLSLKIDYLVCKSQGEINCNYHLLKFKGP